MLLIGDSVGEKTWAGALSPALAARLGRPIRLYNGAVSGYGICQEAAALRELRAALIGAGDPPGLILIQTCANDRHGSPVLLPAEGPGGIAMVRAGGLWMPRMLLRSAAFQQAILYPALQRRSAPILERDLLGCVADMREAAGDAPLIALHFPVLAGSDDARYAPDLRDEEAVAALYRQAGVPGPSLRRVLPAPLSAMRSAPGDQLHPAAAWGERIAASVADAVAPLIPPR